MTLKVWKQGSNRLGNNFNSFWHPTNQKAKHIRGLNCRFDTIKCTFPCISRLTKQVFLQLLRSMFPTGVRSGNPTLVVTLCCSLHIYFQICCHPSYLCTFEKPSTFIGNLQLLKKMSVNVKHCNLGITSRSIYCLNCSKCTYLFQ